MSVQRRVWIGLGLIVLIGGMLVACGGGDQGKDPVPAVQELFQAIDEEKFDQAVQQVCENRRDTFRQELGGRFTELSQLGIDPNELLQTVRINMDNLEFNLVSQEGDSAVVHASGTVQVTFDEAALRDFIERAAQAQDAQIFQEQLDALVNVLMSVGGNQETISEDVGLVRQGQQWRVCDQLDFLANAEIIHLP